MAASAFASALVAHSAAGGVRCPIRRARHARISMAGAFTNDDPCCVPQPHVGEPQGLRRLALMERHY